MDTNKLDLKTLQSVKQICDFQSDMSSRTLGYFWVCRMIDKLTSASKNTSTSDEALPIADVGGCTDLDIEDSASDCAEYYEKQSGENLTSREKACFIDGYNVGGKAVRNRLTKKY